MDAESPGDEGDDVEFTGQGLALGIGVGMAIGASVGVATDNIGRWRPLGMRLGVALGLAFSSALGEDEE